MYKFLIYLHMYIHIFVGYNCTTVNLFYMYTRVHKYTKIVFWWRTGGYSVHTEYPVPLDQVFTNDSYLYQYCNPLLFFGLPTLRTPSTSYTVVVSRLKYCTRVVQHVVYQIDLLQWSPSMQEMSNICPPMFHRRTCPRHKCERHDVTVFVTPNEWPSRQFDPCEPATCCARGRVPISVPFPQQCTPWALILDLDDLHCRSLELLV